ncbi:MAG: hypothetical protein ACRD2B_04370, partial [Terriglobia bacterium]
SKQQPQIVSSPPSVVEMAKKQQARRSSTKGVPLYTNDNLPTESSALGIAGSSALAASGKGNQSAGASSEPVQQIAYLRGKLSRRQQQLEMHQRELSVLQQKLNQSQMQYYPNPYETLRQEYTRKNIHNGTQAVKDKEQQIAEDENEIQEVQDKLQRLLWLNPAAASAQVSERVILPGLKPGTEAYWQARVQVARQQLATAKEGQKLAENELDLLKLQQLRTLDPNLQSELATKIVAKRQELAAAKLSVKKAQAELDQLQKELKASGTPSDVSR